MCSSRSWPRTGRAILLATALAAPAGGAAAFPVAGSQPDARPAGAPTISTFAKGPEWYTRALTGIAPPYPYSFRFLEDQGAWYTPFIRPGMLPPYDLRQWHTVPASTRP